MQNKLIKSILLVLLCTLCLSSNVVFADDSKDTELTYNLKAKVSFVNEYEGKAYEYEYEIGDKLVEPYHPDIKGYIFNGWYIDDYKWDFDEDTVLDHTTLKAKYTAIEGIIKDITIPENNDNNASMSIKAEDIPLTDEDIALMAEGYELDVKLVVETIDSNNVDETEKELIDNKIKQLNETFAQYIDIELFKIINGVTSNIHETNNSIEISLQIPEEYRKTDREYALYRVHDGVLEIMYEGRPLDNWMITFKTDKFSTYALSYKDTGEHHDVPSYPIPNTGVNGTILYKNVSNNYTYLVIGLIVIVSLAVIYKINNKKKHN